MRYGDVVVGGLHALVISPVGVGIWRHHDEHPSLQDLHMHKPCAVELLRLSIHDLPCISTEQRAALLCSYQRPICALLLESAGTRPTAPGSCDTIVILGRHKHKTMTERPAGQYFRVEGSYMYLGSGTADLRVQYEHNVRATTPNLNLIVTAYILSGVSQSTWCGSRRLPAQLGGSLQTSRA